MVPARLLPKNFNSLIQLGISVGGRGGTRRASEPSAVAIRIKMVSIKKTW